MWVCECGCVCRSVCVCVCVWEDGCVGLCVCVCVGVFMWVVGGCVYGGGYVGVLKWKT